jgi:hypothetical protein
MRRHLIIAAVLWCATRRAGAQTGVSGIRPLAFGTLLPGVAATVLPTDPNFSGQFNLTGPNNDYVLLTFSLPSAMTGPGGATLPLVFGGSSVGYSASSSTGSETTFDPHTTQQVRLAHNAGGAGTGAVFLGGTASPSVSQRAGSYSATVTLSATFL